MKKEMKVEVEVDGAPMEGDVPDFGPEIEEAKAVDEEMFSEVAPRGRFSSKSLNALVDAANKLLPIFDQTGDYPKFDTGTYEVFPTDFVRVLSMFSQASRDAVSEDVVSPELVISLDGITDDNDVQVLSGKISGLASSREFKKWLKEPVEEKVEPIAEERPEGTGAMSEEDVDSLFLERM